MKFIPFGKRKNPRRVHGFLCDEKLWLAQWALTYQLGVPHFTLMEHTIQLGGSAVAQIIYDEEARKKLVDHLTDEHLLKPLLDPENPYDKQALAMAQKLEMRRQQFEEVTRELLRLCDVEDVHPWFLLAVARSWIKHLRDRRQRKNDVPQRW